MSELSGLILASSEAQDELAPISGCAAAHTTPVANRPLVQFAYSAIRDAGIDRVAIMVSSRTREAVRSALAGIAGPEPVWIETPEPLEFEDSLLVAADFLRDRPFAVQRGDTILLNPLGPLIDEFALRSADALLLTLAGTPSEPQPVRLVQGAASTLPAPGALAGVHLLGPRALEAAALAAESGGSPDVLGVAGVLRDLGGRVASRGVAGGWNYDGTIDHLLEANRMVLDALEGGPNRVTAEGVRIEGRVSVHPSALVERSTIRGPAVIGAGAVIRDAFIGPYSSIGARARIEGAEIQHSLILPAALIRHPGGRLDASVVGEGAIVSRDFGLPASLRVRVGEGTEIRLA